MVRMYLELSTSNLTEKTVDDLINGKSLIIAYPYEEGLFISVPEKDDFCFDHEIDELSSDLLKLLKYAWENHISLIRLDRDAEAIYDGLPVYKWR